MAKKERKFDSWYATITSTLKSLHYQDSYDRQQARSDFESGMDATEMVNTLMNRQLQQLDEEEEDEL